MTDLCRMVAVALTASLVIAAAAHAQAPNKCLAGKNKCVSKNAQGQLKCHVSAEKNGLSVFSAEIGACLGRTVCKYDGVTGCVPPGDATRGCFAKLEAKQNMSDPATVCPTTGDKDALEQKVYEFVVGDVVIALDPAFPATVTNTCAAGKKKCVLKKMAALLKCYEKAVKAGVAVDAACLDKARCKYDGVTGCVPPGDATRGCFAKLEAKQNTSDPTTLCPTTGDKDTLEQKVDAFVGDVLCELGYTILVGGCATATPTPTPTPILTTTPTPTATPPVNLTFYATLGGPPSTCFNCQTLVDLGYTVQWANLVPDSTHTQLVHFVYNADPPLSPMDTPTDFTANPDGTATIDGFLPYGGTYLTYYTCHDGPGDWEVTVYLDGQEQLGQTIYLCQCSSCPP